MKKRTLSTLMVVAMTMSMITGCGKGSVDNSKDATTAIESTIPEAETENVRELGAETTSERDFSPERLKAFADLKGLDYSESEEEDIGNPDIVMKFYEATNSEANFSASIAEVPAGYKDYIMSGDSGMTIKYEDSVTDAESYLVVGGAMLTAFSEKANYIEPTENPEVVTQSMVDAMNPIYVLMGTEDGKETYILMATDKSYMLNLFVTVDNFSEFADVATFFGLTVSENDMQDVPEYEWDEWSEVTFSGEGMSDEEIAKTLFETDAFSAYEVDEYKILSVEIKEGADRDMIVQDYYPEAGDQDIFAVVKYDVKPYAEVYEDWTVGNGEEDGEWIRNKDSYVHIEHHENGYVMESFGTGW